MAVLKYFNKDIKEWTGFYVAQSGTTFLPSIDPVTQILSWSNNSGLPNPKPISLKPQGIEMYDTRSQFPPTTYALTDTLYVAKDTGTLYRYDPDNKEYTPLSVTAGGKTVLVVTTLPSDTEAESGILYALKLSDDKFELWTKENEKLVLLDSQEQCNIDDIQIKDDNLHLIDIDGNKIGNGVAIDDLADGIDDFVDRAIVTDNSDSSSNKGYDIVTD